MIPFYKFHGTGNDFIMIDGFNMLTLPSSKKIRDACHRHFGIGADGLIIIRPSIDHDFEMVYFNSDGGQATMCGNGARCAVAFAHMIGILSGDISFLAGDGSHTATVEKTGEREWDVNVSIRNVNHPVKSNGSYLINTGTPHLVNLVDNVLDVDIKKDGPTLRHDIRFKPEGVNVNWFSMTPGLIKVRTFEKGVEDETLSCGTGVTACALVAGMLTLDQEWKVETQGGNLRVTFAIKEDKFTDITLGGPADLVFFGETNLL